MVGGGEARMTGRNVTGMEFLNGDFTPESVLNHLAPGTCVEDPARLLPRRALGVRMESYK